MLAASIFLSMWFAMVLVGTLVRDIIHQLNDERLKDPLTQLLNRRGFYEKAKFKLSQITQSSYCLLMCDIDHFKGINEQARLNVFNTLLFLEVIPRITNWSETQIDLLFDVKERW